VYFVNILGWIMYSYGVMHRSLACALLQLIASGSHHGVAHRKPIFSVDDV
jgi:hypothetical protein